MLFVKGKINSFLLQEKNFVLGQLKEKAEMATKTFNSIEGVSCNVVQGAMYAFPNIKLSPKAQEAAKVWRWLEMSFVTSLYKNVFVFVLRIHV